MSDDLAQSLMDEFARSTGLTGKAAPRRYLWTDAFAVCNFLGLHRETPDDRHLELALALVDQVHQVLGRHRADDPRQGWISGLSEAEGARHPTRGGLRIGKKLNERRSDQAYDPHQEWDRDGQYFHYLTKWMNALHVMHIATEEPLYLQWAAELAVAAHRAFTYEVTPGRPKRMFWKMSIDLSRPLVPSMGHHDPLDGLIRCLELQRTGAVDASTNRALSNATTDFARMCQGTNWQTDDSLGIGGLLYDAAALAKLQTEDEPRDDLLSQLLGDVDISLRAFQHESPLHDSANRRLAFRELGLSIGLHAFEAAHESIRSSIGTTSIASKGILGAVERLLAFTPLAAEIEGFWSKPAHRRVNTWTEHPDINDVMLATSLKPAGFLSQLRCGSS